jgi:hypothetical protein
VAAASFGQLWSAVVLGEALAPLLEVAPELALGDALGSAARTLAAPSALSIPANASAAMAAPLTLDGDRADGAAGSGLSTVGSMIGLLSLW